MVRVELPYHLRQMARVDGEVTLDLAGVITPGAVIDALESRYPMLGGTIRDYATGKRRAYLRFFACERDISFDGLDAPLPRAVADGAEPFLIVGALAGG